VNKHENILENSGLPLILDSLKKIKNNWILWSSQRMTLWGWIPDPVGNDLLSLDLSLRWNRLWCLVFYLFLKIIVSISTKTYK
jgi:hypothetical protein